MIASGLSASISESSYYKWIILANVMITTFMAVLDATVVNTALPVIMGTLGAPMNTVEWILTGYMLSLATILAITGWLSSKFGYKLVFIAGLAIFTFGSFMCGNSSTIGSLIFWRIVEGIGGGILMPVGMSIVSSVFPPKERSMALGFWAVATAASVSLGPMFGGYIVDNLNWSYIFYINVPIGIFSILFTAIVQRKEQVISNIKFDIPGFITFSMILLVFIYGLTRVNSSTNAVGWSDPIVLGCMWLSAISFLFFIIIELSVETPLINLRLFRGKNFSFANFVIMIFAMSMFGSTFLIPLYMQDTLGYSAFQAGLVFLPVGIIQAFASPIAGKMIKIVDVRLVIILGLILLSGSFLLNYYLTLQTTKSYIIHSLILRGVGLGIIYPPLLAVALSRISPPDLPQASSLVNITRQIGGSIGVALFTFMLSERRVYHSQTYSEAINYTGQEYNNVINNLTEFYIKNGSDNHINAIDKSKDYIVQWLDKEAYISAINDDFMIGALITIISIIPVLFLTVKKKKIN